MDEEYIKRVNKTYSKAFSQRQSLPNYISNIFETMKWLKILDYGAGKDAFGTIMLREKGFDVIAYDIGKNYIEGLHDSEALTKKYGLVFASNVINIQSSHEDIANIFYEVHSCMKNKLSYGYSEFYFNIPLKPRKCNFDNIITLSDQVFGKGMSKLVYGEIYKCTKSEI